MKIFSREDMKVLKRRKLKVRSENNAKGHVSRHRFRKEMVHTKGRLAAVEARNVDKRSQLETA